MLIQLKKFGPTLVSRPSGREAMLAYQPILNSLQPNESLEIDFEGVIAFGPSWGDEFLTPIFEKYKANDKWKPMANYQGSATPMQFTAVCQTSFWPSLIMAGAIK